MVEIPKSPVVEAVPGTPSSPEAKPEAPRERVAEKYAQILSKVGTAAHAPIDPTAVQADAASLGPEEDVQATVEKLVQLAETKGVAHAVRVAQKLSDFYILDTMHDRLANDLYAELAARGLVTGEV